MLIKKPVDIKPSEITDEAVYQQRRRFMRSTAGLALATAGLGSGIMLPTLSMAKTSYGGKKLKIANSKDYADKEQLTPYEDITQYNNFYEFGTDKYSPAKLAHNLKTEPWSLTIAGEVNKPGTYHLEDILKPHALEERIYRLRCVEAWSMVVPWVGVSLGDLIKRFEPRANAKYVKFTTLLDPKQMPGQNRSVLDWPYVEGLRMDEAMHPLTLFVVGLYGEMIPNQNGAPIRLIVPWKYGFKSIKSIVRLDFVEQQPVSSWTNSAPSEYGFYSNVNPKVRHPRWSQARERRIGEFFKRGTLMFNGYADQVAHLYAGMDLKKHF